MSIHTFICCFLMLSIAFSQSYFGKKYYYERTDKARKQYRVVNMITGIIMFIGIIVGIYMTNPFGC
jgi:hypothetical protein